MDRRVPLWILLILLILWILGTVAFGWAVKSSLGGSSRSGVVGRAAVQIASFPNLARDTFAQLFGYATGDYKDEAVSVVRPASADYSGFAPVEAAPDIGVEGLLVRAELDRIAQGWRILVGAFAVDGDIENAALLMSPELKIVKKWVLTETPVGESEPRPDFLRFPHGLIAMKDGSLIFTFDGSISLQRMDSCDRRDWVVEGGFNHSVSLSESGKTVWAVMSGGSLGEVGIEDGKLLRQITEEDIIAANPMIDILEVRRVHDNDLGGNSRNTKGKWRPDAIHVNDVEPLPADLSGLFPGFDTGDLLVSARSLNLVFVLDPDTLEVKWWRSGDVQRQHDPDWLSTGEIMVYNNRMSRDFSEIVAIDPETFERRTIFDGRENDFYSRIRGKSQMLDDGTLVVTSPQQGRAFEVDETGEVVLELANLKPGSDTVNYAVSELTWLPLGYFDAEKAECLSDIIKDARNG